MNEALQRNLTFEEKLRYGAPVSERELKEEVERLLEDRLVECEHEAYEKGYQEGQIDAIDQVREAIDAAL